MTISAQGMQPALSSQVSAPIVDTTTGLPTETMRKWMEGIFTFINGSSRLIPCNCTNVGNVYTLTLASTQPLIKQYSDYDIFVFVASATSTGTVTGLVQTATGSLATINWYKTNGSAQAGSGDIQLNSLYLAIFNDALNSGAGGLVIK